MSTATQQKWTGRWEQVTGKAKEFWGWLTDDQLKQVEGNEDKLVGLIHERTGEAREAIEKRLRDSCSSCS
jgi:uncharacterized protein YjbJ (UPF0337 family)